MYVQEKFSDTQNHEKSSSYMGFTIYTYLQHL
jgi:hypothetical protein